MSEIKYSVTIRDETESGKTTVAGAPEQTTTTPGTPLTQSGAERSASTGKLATALVAVKAVEPYVNQAASFAVSQIQFSTGSAELQQRAQVFSGMASSAYAIGMAAITGGAAGAAIMVGLQVLQKSVAAVQAVRNIEARYQMEDETLAIRRSRVGYIAKRSRGGET